ncbi:zinc finger protein 420-like isoform X2 [Siniperca chuatsi]|uniref:zinc finger protein 420-like isoform X2 n=1 Tax=Siniperca chuatsi TaxID=119488 RepID=UPI001CE07D4D|nr:zinc finger protein 420-like isoform X2 [Siniperca chuatsi]
MSRFQEFKDSVKLRLRTAARKHLVEHLDTKTSGYEKELDRQQRLPDQVSDPDLKLRRADVQQLSLRKEEVPPEQQNWSPSLDQDPEPPHIKEEQEELWISQEGELLRGLEEADITKFPFTPVPVKSEEDEEKPQSSQLHQSQTELMETGANGEDCGGPGPARNSDPDTHLQPDTDDKTEDSSETETDDSDKNWRDPDSKQFRCSVCGKTFKHRGNLNIHMRTHTGVKPFSCSVCGKRFTQKAGLDYHLRTHTGERPFICSVCGKTFRHKGALTYHMATHTGVKPFSCSDCGKRFRGTSQLKIHKCVGESSQLHKSQSDKRKKPLSCSECDATFPNNYLLMTHMRMHKGKKLFTCTVCGQKRQFSSHLEIHMRTHTGEKPYSCSVCGKRFSQRGIMTQHMAVHSGVKPFGCSDCGKRFFWQFQIKKHKCLGESSQQRRTGFNGQDCGGSESVRNLDPDKHLKPDSDKKTKPSFETDDSVDIEFWKETRQHQSGFTYRRNKKVSVKTEPKTDDSVGSGFCKQTRQCQSGLNDLKNEEVSLSDTGYNTDKKPFSSSECHKRSKGSHTLQTHKKCHTGEKPFSCLFCGKGFATGGYLTRHTCVHTGEKLLSCIVCEKRFPLESELISHECVGESSKLLQSRTEEQITANKLFSCSQCGKGFGRKHQLQVHMRIHAKTFARRENLSFHMTCHTGEKPFCCSVCNTGFSDSESLVKHMRIHTGQTQFSCSICGKEFAWRRYLTKHMEVHAKEKIYRCSVCDRGFTRIYQLNYHECVGESSQLLQSRTEEHITANKLFRCSQCGKGFGRKYHLKVHMRIHTGEKPFSCSLCGKGFIESGNLKVHMRAHTGKKQFSCSVCDKRFTLRSQLKIHQCVGHQSSQLHQNQTEQMETGADGEGCGEPGPARNSDPDTYLQPDTDDKTSESSETEDSDDGWEETRDPQSGLNSLKNDLVSQSETTCDTGRKRFSCSECGETFHNNHLLKIHIRNHTGEYREAKQEDPEPPHIKEEQEELWTSQEGEQLRGLEEADITKFPFTPVPVKSEEDEEKPQSSQLHQSQTEQMETGADGEDCGGPGPARNSDPDTHLQPETDDNPGISFKTDDSVDSDFWKDNRKPQLDLNSLKKNEISESVMGCDSGKKAFSCSDDKASETLEPESDDSVDSDFWKDNRKPQLDLNVLKNNDVSESEMRSNTLGKPYSCSECGKGFLSICNMKNHMKFHTGERAFFCSVCGQKCLYKSHLKIHMRTHTGEKPFICPVCGKKYAHKASMQSHMVVHTVDKQYTCNVCDKSFAWYTELKYHHCVGESSRQTPHWGETM